MKFRKEFSIKKLLIFIKDKKNKKFLLKNKKILKNFGLSLNWNKIQNRNLNKN